MSDKITTDEWRAELMRVQDIWPSDKGQTRREIAERLDLKLTAAGYFIRDGIANGRIIRGRSYRPDMNGAMRLVPVYQLKREPQQGE